MSWYRDGTISLTKNSATVTGVGTVFSSEVRFSDILLVSGALYEVSRINSDTQLTLSTPFLGATVSNSAYAIIRNLTNASNYELMKKIEAFLTDRQRSMDEFVDWINGTFNGGANKDGKFPLTDRYGVTVQIKSPAQLMGEIDALRTQTDTDSAELKATLDDAQARLKAIGDQQAWANMILGYRDAAATSATNAKTSEANAKTSETKAGTSKTAAAASETNAKASETNAKTSETNAKTSETNAASSATNAATSATSAGTSATNAKTSETNAKTSETNAGTSAVNASTSAATAQKWAENPVDTAVTGSAYSAKHHATKAAASATAAATSAGNASTSANNASTSANNAKTSETNAANSASAALESKNSAEAAATRAENASAITTGGVSEAGSIDMSSNAFPATPPQSCFWKVTVAGTAGGIDFGVGDTLVYSKNLGEFYKIDNTESVTSVNGKKGVVSLAPTDVGAEPAVTAGTDDQYWSGTKVWKSFSANVRAMTLTGIVTSTAAVITAADSILSALGKLQAQILTKANSIAPVFTGRVDVGLGVDASTVADNTSAALRVVGAENDGTQGLTVQSYAPTVSFVDRSENAKAARWRVDGSAMALDWDNADKGSTWNNPVVRFQPSGEVISFSANAYRIISGNYGAFFRMDGSSFYLLFTASGDQYGTWNALRPFSINVSTGKVVISNGLETVTPAKGDNTNNAASTAFVQTELSGYASKASPTFTGTATFGDGAAGAKVQIGDDATINDINLAGAFAVKGVADATKGYIAFGNNANGFGWNGTDLVYGANKVLHAGNISTYTPTFANVISSNAPTQDSHVVNKGYLESLSAKNSVRVASLPGGFGAATATANTLVGRAATVTTSGSTTSGSTSVTGVTNATNLLTVGATVAGTGIPSGTTVTAISGTTLTISAAATATGTPSLTFTQTIGPLVIDGVTLALGDRVLAKDLYAPQNGLYYLSTLGTTSVAWVLTRSTDAASWSDLISAYTAVEEGATNQNRMFQCTVNRGGTIGTTAVTFQEILTGASTTIAAQTATKLATARMINGVSFDGTANVTVADATKLPLTGGTLTGALMLQPAGNATIEMGRIDGSASTPFIDFHSGATAVDYDARILATGGNGAVGNGALTFTAKGGTFFPDTRISLTTATTDSPELCWSTSKWSMYADIAADTWRIFGSAAGSSTIIFPMTLDLAAQTGSIFGNHIWTSKDFQPGTSASKNLSGNNVYDTVAYISSSGVMEIGRFIDMHTADNDGTDFAVRLEAGSDKNLYLTSNGAAGRVWTSKDLDDLSKVPRRGGTVETQGMYIRASNVPSLAGMTDAYYDQVALTIDNGANQNAAALMQFHRVGSYAAYFGLDTDNLWKVGGRSMGQAGYAVWHDGMDFTTRIRNAIASFGGGSVGSYGLFTVGGGGATTTGTTVSGGNLAWSSAAGNVSGNPTGTWRIMGNVLNTDGASSDSVTLCLRIA